jgi:hypothetical protein
MVIKFRVGWVEHVACWGEKHTKIWYDTLKGKKPVGRFKDIKIKVIL